MLDVLLSCSVRATSKCEEDEKPMTTKTQDLSARIVTPLSRCWLLFLLFALRCGAAFLLVFVCVLCISGCLKRFFFLFCRERSVPTTFVTDFCNFML